MILVKKLVNETWNFLEEFKTVDEMVEDFQRFVKKTVDDTFPKKTIKIYSEDQPYFTEKLRMLKRRRMTKYKKEGKSENYYRIQKEFDTELKKQIHN